MLCSVYYLYKTALLREADWCLFQVSLLIGEACNYAIPIAAHVMI